MLLRKVIRFSLQLRASDMRSWYRWPLPSLRPRKLLPIQRLWDLASAAVTSPYAEDAFCWESQAVVLAGLDPTNSVAGGNPEEKCCSAGVADAASVSSSVASLMIFAFGGWRARVETVHFRPERPKPERSSVKPFRVDPGFMKASLSTSMGSKPAAVSSSRLPAAETPSTSESSSLSEITIGPRLAETVEVGTTRCATPLCGLVEGGGEAEAERHEAGKTPLIRFRSFVKRLGSSSDFPSPSGSELSSESLLMSTAWERRSKRVRAGTRRFPAFVTMTSSITTSPADDGIYVRKLIITVCCHLIINPLLSGFLQLTTTFIFTVRSVLRVLAVPLIMLCKAYRLISALSHLSLVDRFLIFQLRFLDVAKLVPIPYHRRHHQCWFRAACQSPDAARLKRTLLDQPRENLANTGQRSAEMRERFAAEVSSLCKAPYLKLLRIPCSSVAIPKLQPDHEQHCVRPRFQSAVSECEQLGRQFDLNSPHSPAVCSGISRLKPWFLGFLATLLRKAVVGPNLRICLQVVATCRFSVDSGFRFRDLVLRPHLNPPPLRDPASVSLVNECFILSHSIRKPCDVIAACQVAKPIEIVSWRRLLRKFDGRVVGLARLGHRQIRGPCASLRMLPRSVAVTLKAAMFGINESSLLANTIAAHPDLVAINQKSWRKTLEHFSKRSASAATQSTFSGRMINMRSFRPTNRLPALARASLSLAVAQRNMRQQPSSTFKPRTPSASRSPPRKPANVLKKLRHCKRIN
ncbi:hypothetical protein KC360_g229 [Hortaea werneckii]|nr:hypothetical protein KC360_g229 [Hortaea werneckii]